MSTLRLSDAESLFDDLGKKIKISPTVPLKSERLRTGQESRIINPFLYLMCVT